MHKKFKLEIKKLKSTIEDLKLKNKLLKISLDIDNSFINNNNSNTDVYQLLLDNVLSLIGNYKYGSFLIYDSDNYLFNYKAVVGYDFNIFKFIEIKLTESFIYRNSDNEFNDSIIIKNIKEHNIKYIDSENAKLINNNTPDIIKETLSIPIKIDNEIYGFINIDSTESFSEKEIEIFKSYPEIIKDVIYKNDMVKRTFHLSKYDKLTNIYNRSYFEDVFDKYSKQCIRYNLKYSFILIDLNYLKQINDNFGHITGDEALCFFSNKIKTYIRETDIFARLGGDEFILILHDSTYKQSEIKMQRILNSFLNKKFTFTNHDIIDSFYITFSYGISTSPDESMIFDILLRLADKKMYEFKRLFKKNNPDIIPKKRKAKK